MGRQNRLLISWAHENDVDVDGDGDKEQKQHEATKHVLVTSSFLYPLYGLPIWDRSKKYHYGVF